MHRLDFTLDAHREQMLEAPEIGNLQRRRPLPGSVRMGVARCDLQPLLPIFVEGSTPCCLARGVVKSGSSLTENTQSAENRRTVTELRAGNGENPPHTGRCRITFSTFALSTEHTLIVVIMAK